MNKGSLPEHDDQHSPHKTAANKQRLPLDQTVGSWDQGFVGVVLGNVCRPEGGWVILMGLTRMEFTHFLIF